MVDVDVEELVVVGAVVAVDVPVVLDVAMLDVEVDMLVSVDVEVLVEEPVWPQAASAKAKPAVISNVLKRMSVPPPWKTGGPLAPSLTPTSSQTYIGASLRRGGAAAVSLCGRPRKRTPFPSIFNASQ